MDSAQIIILSGNIAAGKTTVGRIVTASLKACFVPEPVERWMADGMLQKFYENPTKTAYTFQTYVLNSRIEAYVIALDEWRKEHDGATPAIVVLDRWIEDDYIFASLAYENKQMSNGEFATYMQIHKRVKSAALLNSKNVTRVLINVSPSTCLERLSSRKDPLDISPEYLAKLDEKHRQLIVSFTVDNELGTAEDTAKEIIQQWKRYA
tara:strand:- start:1652 stop:2275 length:624 start_codon:yes stop_codon:yes gene_type:complete